MVPDDYHWYFSCLDQLLRLFPTNRLRLMTLYTSQQLVKHGEKETNKGEMIKWFGIIILATCFEFLDRASLWSTVSQSKYRNAPAFGKTGMNRHRLDMPLRHVRWSHQPDEQGEGKIHEAYRWELVEEFVTNLNDYHTQLFSP